MKTLIAVIAIALFGGCAMKENKMTVCSGINLEECPAWFIEVKADGLPVVGGVAEKVKTCARYADKDEDVICPEGSKKITLDFVK